MCMSIEMKLNYQKTLGYRPINNLCTDDGDGYSSLCIMKKKLSILRSNNGKVAARQVDWNREVELLCMELVSF